MWEAIAANRRRSVLIIAVMGIVLITLGSSIGLYIGSQLAKLPAGSIGSNGDELLHGGGVGGASAALLWLILWFMAVFRGDRVLLHSAGARELRKWDHPRLWNVVEEMTIAAGLPKMPRVFLIEDPSPNAFAVGRTPEKAVVAVTSGLLRLLNRDELQGVIAHEIGHIRNLDIRFMTIAAVLVASVELISRSVLRGAGRAGRGRRSSSSKGKGAGLLLVIVLIFVVLSPIVVRLLYLATSRSREYLADASAARFTRYPQGLASALEKITVHQSSAPAADTSGALAALYIVNPIEKAALAGLFSTHPPTEKRIKILRSMGGGAGYVDYEAALRKIEKRNVRLAALAAAAQSEGSVSARAPSAEPEGVTGDISRAREVGDLLDHFAGYVIFPCSCGMRIKMPPESKLESVTCPRCMLAHQVPAAEPAAAKESSPVSGPSEPPNVSPAGSDGWQYERRERGWESFRCVCGQTIQLGHDYPLDYTVCVQCNRRIALLSGKEAASTASVEPVA